ncbi:MAG: hypothetical protein CMO80_23335 [Verrucomicrobiales bacterium]|nr:hypothetical protein [Verrucomicrobiales bacterium]
MWKKFTLTLQTRSRGGIIRSMIEVHQSGSDSFCDGMNRRAMLRIGGLSSLGLSLPQLLKGFESSKGTFGRARRVLMLFMWGGPSHIDLFDMKPDAPTQVRGSFRPVSTKVPGVQLSELLPHLGRHTDKIGFIRSVTHSDNNHSTSAHWMLTGHKHELARENQGARRSDYPHMGSVLNHLRPSRNGLPGFVALPEVIGTTQGYITPGQDGGFLGQEHDPFRIDQHPVGKEFKVANLNPSVNSNRLRSRAGLQRRFDEFRGELIDAAESAELSAVNQRAVDLVTNSKVHEAFNLRAEGARERQRYGMKPFGQSVLLARRLMEAGVPLVTVYWHRDMPGVDTTWDTHGDNFNQLKNRLVPQTDQPVAHLLSDLHERGLLDDTLVFWNSEFGRTPKINGKAGRDHWGRCNTIWMAGAGVPGGHVYGKSDKIASEPVSDPVSPEQVAATVYHLLGLDPHTEIRDRLDRPFPIADAAPLHRFLAGA